MGPKESLTMRIHIRHLSYLSGGQTRLRDAPPPSPFPCDSHLIFRIPVSSFTMVTTRELRIRAFDIIRLVRKSRARPFEQKSCESVGEDVVGGGSGGKGGGGVVQRWWEREGGDGVGGEEAR